MRQKLMQRIMNKEITKSDINFIDRDGNMSVNSRAMSSLAGTSRINFHDSIERGDSIERIMETEIEETQEEMSGTNKPKEKSLKKKVPKLNLKRLAKTQVIQLRSGRKINKDDDLKIRQRSSSKSKSPRLDHFN